MFFKVGQAIHIFSTFRGLSETRYVDKRRWVGT
jgi:hypothetical protein